MCRVSREATSFPGTIIYYMSEKDNTKENTNSGYVVRCHDINIERRPTGIDGKLI